LSVSPVECLSPCSSPKDSDLLSYLDKNGVAGASADAVQPSQAPMQADDAGAGEGEHVDITMV
jgi:hypothetical protein